MSSKQWAVVGGEEFKPNYLQQSLQQRCWGQVLYSGFLVLNVHASTIEHLLYTHYLNIHASGKGHLLYTHDLPGCGDVPVCKVWSLSFHSSHYGSGGRHGK